MCASGFAQKPCYWLGGAAYNTALHQSLVSLKTGKYARNHYLEAGLNYTIPINSFGAVAGPLGLNLAYGYQNSPLTKSLAPSFKTMLNLNGQKVVAPQMKYITLKTSLLIGLGLRKYLFGNCFLDVNLLVGNVVDTDIFSSPIAGPAGIRFSFTQYVSLGLLYLPHHKNRMQL